MRLPRHYLRPLLAAAVGLALGFGARHVGDTHAGETPVHAQATSDVADNGAPAATPGGATATTPALLTPAASAAAVDAIVRSRGNERVRRLALFLPQADAAAVEALARHFCDPRTEEDGDLCTRLVLARWGEVDAPGCVAFCRTITPSKGERAWLVGNAFEAWARVDYAAALAAADTPRNRTSALLGLSSGDPLRALAELEADRGNFRGPGNLPWADIFARLAPVDPARAAALLPRAAGGYSYMASQSVVKAWARKDPAAAAAWLAKSFADPWQTQQMVQSWQRSASESGQPLGSIVDGLPPGPLRVAMRSEILAAEARDDPEGTLARTMAMPAGHERQFALSALVRGASERGDWRTVLTLGEALQWRADAGRNLFSTSIHTAGFSYSSDFSDTTQEAFGTALRKKMAEDGDFSSVWSLVTRNRSNPMLQPNEVIGAWLAKAPEAAAKAVLSADGSAGYAQTLGQQWAALDPAAAQRHWATLPEGSAQRSTFLSGIALQQATRDPTAALEWVESLPTGDRGQARETVVSQWASREPSAAVQAVLATPSLQEKPEFVASLVSSVSERDPAAAAPLLALLPQGENAGQFAFTYEQFTQSYAAKDARAASEWIAAMPEGAFKDRSISGLVSHLTTQDPDFPAALAWAGAAGDEAIRQNLATSVFEQWCTRDAAAARAAVQQSHLPPATKTLLLGTP